MNGRLYAPGWATGWAPGDLTATEYLKQYRYLVSISER